ncbi:MAG: RluA family pseudouridine synthase [Verrucomicrobia bacterium]|nr:RluA family pseudouridine synthase [Verrucomicrobiota bacterium]MBU4246827.1 RluA family pseudouridine synthase [Verrucomicrobiota bacterium]MBU4291821.1 RluA family pseudouridine synthase [Verrucomicrobiota bacterium]MBU4429423.1 RluA family pseudouridine synthase [Verrucomicrobiota bacterium]MCG2680820.1 RluA family pseudouridine synthase [Kiritimatiellia bacterium]
MITDLTLTIPPEETGVRLDVWLTRRVKTISRSRIKALIQAGHITLDGHAVKEHHKTRAGETVRVVIPPLEDTTLRPEPIPLDILYQDSDLMVINKPAGLVVHPAAGHPSGTLVNALLFHCPELAGIGGERRPGIVHRLDKDTSGVLVAAKNDRAMAGLAAQFKARQVEKHYLALVWGRPHPPTGTIETLIGRHRQDRKRMSARPRSGRPALTQYETLKVFDDITLLRIHIITGRTHQIRVHMAYRCHPVVGDRQYGLRSGRILPVPVPRQMLHAEQLVLMHPATGRRLSFTAPLPADMTALLNALRKRSQSET